MDPLQHFEAISLEEMDSVKLMERVDTKYVFPAHSLPDILNLLAKDYRVLEISGNRNSRYETIYYDTPGLDMYLQHHNGRQNRFKVRYRGYSDSGASFFEVKHHTNKGKMVKKRIPAMLTGGPIRGAEQDFLQELTPYTSKNLVSVLRVFYFRITLVGWCSCEWVILDTGLQVESVNRSADYSAVVIAETKQDRACSSLFRNVMLQHRIFPGSVSKYCLGITALYPDVKKNRFKEKYRIIHQLTRPAYA